jgi:hypothetical protein
LTFEITSKNKKGKSWSTIDTKNMFPSKLSSIHRVTGDALDVSIINMEEENLRLNERVKELEATLMPPPVAILATLVAMIQLGINLQGNPESNLRVKEISSLIISIGHLVENNINKIMFIILDLWNLEKKNSSLELKIQNTKEHFNAYLKNDEGFFTYGVAMFIEKVSTMTNHTRKWDHFPS